MLEITGNLWDYYGKPGHVVCITTNGFVKKNGDAVMGRGCAWEATQRIPDIARTLGNWIRDKGNVPGWIRYDLPLIAFPVKHNWFEKADIKLIRDSADWLRLAAKGSPHTFILPRPGCGNGQLTWSSVKPALFYLPDNVLVIDFAK